MGFSFERIDMDAFTKDLISMRRDLHRHPESGWTEYRTTVKVIEQLTALGLKVTYGKSIHTPEHMYGMPSEEYLKQCEARAVAECGREDLIAEMRGGFTGCVTEIEGAQPGPTIGFRVDIDCNDVAESTDEDHRPFKEGFASTHANLMHACGHDGHAAIGIGALRLLLAYRDQIKGKIVFVFQPAEEGLRGANSIAQSGVLDKVNYMIGAHLGLKKWELGTVATGTHGFLASTKFDVTFQGKASHAGASPEQGNNALAAAATATLNLLAIPRHSAGSSRINIGTLNAGTGRNVIPETAVMTVETRGVTTDINAYMAEKAERVCRASADMYECSYESRFMGAAGSAVCDKELVEKVSESISELPDVKEIHKDVDFGGGEDFTYMMSKVQSQGGQATEMIIGTPLKAPHHNGRFDFDEAALPLAAQIFAKIALDICK
ncbi:amidohydrolase [Oscillospiraceae bacterium LTW-04]|nr:amidohydrolase [Oscillospiraceae bacterium MB24-C1]